MHNLIKIDKYPVWPVLPILLKDRTTKRNIIWATASYALLGEAYLDSAQMTESALRHMGRDAIQPRVLKAQEEQQKRTRTHGEVQTPAWVCCLMNDFLDEEWFGRKGAFGALEGRTWTPTEGAVVFPKQGCRHSSWKMYVDSRRLEITCGEAPFIASRYDAATGEPIPIERRIGLLDRKLRIVTENTDNEQDWLKWAIRAIESVYGYEYQGDNLLIARINIFLTFVEHVERLWRRKPTERELETVARIVSWNFWQMDGLTGTVPKGKLRPPEPQARPITMEELGWFDGIDAAAPPKPVEGERTPPCRVCNWRQVHSVTFDSLKTHRGRDVRDMKFDFCIGNPPYQEEYDGASSGANSVYNMFMDAAFEISDHVELVTPGRFLFNAGSTPKAWNTKMLSDIHFKVLQYVSDASQLFSNVIITGGIAITYRDASQNYGAIETFTAFEPLNSILRKVKTEKGFSPLSTIAVTSFAYHFTDVMHKDHPEAAGLMSKGHANDLKSNCFKTLSHIFTIERQSENDARIFGRDDEGRAYRYIKREYINNVSNFDKYKVFLSKADGASGTIGNPVPARIVGTLAIGNPHEGSTESFLSIGNFDTLLEAENLAKYIRTRFARTMLGVLKVTQDITPSKWHFVPLQDFTLSSDIDWTQPIPDIDRQLYRKYGLTEEEIAFIETHVKEMS